MGWLCERTVPCNQPARRTALIKKSLCFQQQAVLALSFAEGENSFITLGTVRNIAISHEGSLNALSIWRMIKVLS